MRRIALSALLAAALAAGCQMVGTPNHEQEAVDHYAKGQVLLAGGQTDLALEELAKAVELDPGLSIAYAAIGDIYRKEQAYELAAHAYGRACETNPYNFRSHYNLGVIRQTLADSAKDVVELKRQLGLAVEVYVRAITIRPNDFDANLNLGVCYFQLDRLDKAEQYTKAATAIDPSQANGHTNLGAVYDRQGRYYEAVSEYKKSLELNTDQPRMLVNLATTYVKQGRHKQAIHDYEMAAQMDPASAIPMERLGYCHYYLGDYDKAAECYQTALALDKHFAEAHRGLGVVYMTEFVLHRQPEMRDKALACWNSSLEIDPGQADLLRLVAKYTPKLAGPEL